MSSPLGIRASVPRLIAEFFVILIGVLGALAADQWAQDRENRGLESEYLERLRTDAEYDREEIQFVLAVSRSGLGRETLFNVNQIGVDVRPNYRGYDVDVDDQSLLMIQFGGGSEDAPNEFILVQNWLEDVRERLGR